MTSPNTIILKPTRLSDRYDEARAGGAITPGHLIANNAAGAVVVHPTAGGAAELNIAIEDSFQGKTINDAYASTDLVRFQRLQDGDEFYGFLAAHSFVDPTNFLASNGDGTFRPASGSDAILGRSIEAVVNNTASAVRLRIRAGKTAGTGTTVTTTTT